MTKSIQHRESLPMQTRMAPIGSVDAENRTAVLLWTAGATGRRYDWYNDRYYSEELSMEPGHVRMERFQSGKAPLLNSHSSYDLLDVIGVIESASGAEAVVRFSSRADVEPIFQDVKDRILRNVSVGYAVYKREMIPPVTPDGDWIYRIIDWEPMELSIVAIPFDAGAEIRTGGGNSKQQKTFDVINVASTRSLSQVKENQMSNEQISPADKDAEIRSLERQRIQDIREYVRMSQLDNKEHLINEYISRGLDVATVGIDLLRRQAARSEAFNIRSAAALDIEENNGTASPIEPMVDALVARLTGRPAAGPARQYAGYRMVDFARDILQINGVRTTNLSPNELIVRSFGGHTTSDFPHLLQASGERVLRQAYESYQGGLRRISRQTTARDFRAKSAIMLGEAPELLKVNEGGEYKRGTMAESREAYRLETFGRIFGISRQALVNDDLSAFGDLTRRLGIAASEFVANQLVGLLRSNPVMSDGVTLFHTSHKNIAAAGGTISDASLSAARLAMRTQKGLDGKTVIDVTPKYLIVPAALENIAMKYLASLTPQAVSDVNPFAGTLELVVDPRLDAFSPTAWYLAADPEAIDTIEYAYLEEAPGPTIETRVGFEVDGIEMKVSLDFGGGILDYRGLYFNAGA